MSGRRTLRRLFSAIAAFGLGGIMLDVVPDVWRRHGWIAAVVVASSLGIVLVDCCTNYVDSQRAPR